MCTPKYITLEVEKISEIIILAINKLGSGGTHMGHIAKTIKEALIEKRVMRDVKPFKLKSKI